MGTERSIIAAPEVDAVVADLARLPFFLQHLFMSDSTDEMQYGMIGKDGRTTEEKLAKYTGEVDWPYLKAHFENGSLFFVDPTVKLETVGVAITHDEKEQVEAWLKTGDLVKIEALHAQQWEDDTEQQFEALVVSPFVLCRPSPQNP